MTPDARLRRAREHIFLCGVGDAAEQLCEANLAYGLAKIQHVEQQLGLRPAAAFIGAPDATVTRNRQRWESGFGYGGQVRWSPELAVLDALPNGCGMVVGGLARAPREHDVRDAAAQARATAIELDGVPLVYDLDESNHFVDVCELESPLGESPPQLPAHLAIIHSSGHEHRARSPFGPGLYVHESPALREQAETHTTPWGPLRVLRNQAAADYFDFCRAVQDFNKRRRRRYAELLFGEQREICNETHQGLRAPGVFHLGSYWFDGHAATGEDAPLFPLTLGPDQPVYLLRPRPSFSPAAIEALGWTERAARHELTAAIRSANLLPHGGGYAFGGLRRLLRTEQDASGRSFVLEQDDGRPYRLTDVRARPFGYRRGAVLERVLALGLAEPVARYRIRFVSK